MNAGVGRDGYEARAGDLAELFARAPFEEGGWERALKTLASRTGSSRAQLLALGDRHAAFNWVTDADPSFLTEFDKIGGYRPDVNYRVASTRAPLELSWEAHYAEARAVSTNEAYLDYVRRHDAEFGVQMVLSQRVGVLFGLAALHGSKDGVTTEAQRDVFRQVGPAVLDAIRLQDAIEHQGADLLKGSLESMRNAAILLDAVGKVCGMTSAAQALLGPRTLQVRGGGLFAARPDLDQILQKRIAAALAGTADGPADLWLRGDNELLLIDARTLPRQDWTFGFAPRAIVTLRAPLALDQLPARRLAEALGLTLAEAEVVTLLAQGHSRQATAQLRGVSVQTVVAQLRTIFQKCGVNREAELVAIARTMIEMASR
ncbi:MAG: helix-turn-helix transcriptional regulator [Novosphingobium pentaromativorans]|uniref:Helix-turn-helix transcriptional regulator n=1 Tax=Novosphingobium pentaromativorans TaxID=205844 RepID=A0A2W5NFH1_9SPHN|nr:MAG: helix-turn-helix transcriptional regulator [Novosphingobium pentaromativorans]